MRFILNSPNFFNVKQILITPLVVAPDVVVDFRNMPFEDETFYLVVSDPPHLIRVGEKSWLSQKYGKLNRGNLGNGFDECMRVLKPSGTLIFKWNEDQISKHEVLNCFGHKPLFGDKRSKTHWVTFIK
ncbi:SAM-dependent methyltransferase [Cytobacillus purgationiresistens]|uniref:SAM-dependent methyltransferase n=1 Tax=Cytobacillus purgationiresistens TaxID=863449 RepID=UPI0027D89634|nr:SAM-dependent methyltransferase [Cytobacillus purgationiresistens]